MLASQQHNENQYNLTQYNDPQHNNKKATLRTMALYTKCGVMLS